MSDSFTDWVNNLNRVSKGAMSLVAMGNQIPLANFMVSMNASLSYPVVSNSRLVGNNAANALQADTQFMNARSMGQIAAAQSMLSMSPATAMAMILAMAQKASGFNPAAPAQADNMDGFLRYVYQLFQCPVLHNQLNDQVYVNYGSDWNTTINNIMGYYVGIAPGDLQTIKDSLWTIARAAASTPNTCQSENLFVQNSLNIDNGYKLYMYKTIIQMVEEQYKGSGKNAPTYTNDKTTFLLYREIFALDESQLANYAPLLMSQTDSSLHNWLNDNSVPVNQQAVNWTCIPQSNSVPNYPMPPHGI